ncbi:MAG: HAMP domain-containing protein, partial [Actinobacteria bacterium]|nr:HAMP domain-containing protein [Actinomycetota bacterium]
RLRLTALYGGLFLVCGAMLLTTMYFVVRHQYSSDFFVASGKKFIVATASSVPLPKIAITKFGIGKIPVQVLKPNPTPAQLALQAQAQSTAALHKLLVDCAFALAVMAVISIWLGWIVAGRALRPLRTITNAARDISETNLHRRLALDGPNDEIHQLGTTFDGLLERLERAFDAQRRFVANASHELRTPLTYERALLEVALADPDATERTLREVCSKVLAVGEQQERTIEALLTLSRSQRGLESRETVDLAAIASAALARADTDDVTVRERLGTAVMRGDPRLIERLVANLVDNAVTYNVPDGEIAVSTHRDADRAVLTVENTGPVIPTYELDRIFQPFQRLDPERTNNRGTGLGLSIVQAIATAHGAALVALPRPLGGLRVEVAFPA